jgi:autotransporter-associated beta strand protein
MKIRVQSFLAAAAAVAFAVNAHAATWWWDGGTLTTNAASDNVTTIGQNWLSGGNWDNGTVDGPIAAGNWNPGDSAVFGGSASSQTITAGTLTVGNMTFGAGGAGSGTSGTAYSLAGPGITLSSGSLITNNTATTISGVLAGTSGSLTKWGPAQLTLSAKNTYGGGTTVNQGTLAFGSDNLGTSYIGKGTLTINSGATATGTGGDNPLGYTANIIHSLVINGGTYTTVASGGHWTDTITMTGGAINGAGHIDMQSASGYTDTITVNASATPSTISVGTFALNAATTINVASGGTCIVSNVISGGSSLTKTGNGLLTLQGANSYTGATAVNGGTLLVNGSLASGSAVTVSGATLGGVGTVNGSASIGNTSVLAPGTATNLGTLTFGSTLTLNAGSTNVLRVNRTSGVLSADKVMAGSSGLAYNGALVVVSNANSDAFQSGDKFTLFGKAGGSFTGSFASTNLPALPAGYQWDTSQLAVDGSILVYAPSVVASPTFSPAGGGFIGAQSVSLGCATAGATIYYTTNGSTPTAASAVYATAISVPVNTTLTIKAFAAKSGMTDSAVGSATYATLAAPVWVNAAGGSWAASGNWSNSVVGQGSSVTADFSQLTLPAAAGVTLDSAPVIGNLLFGDQGNTYGWAIGPGSGGPLTLAGSDTPVIAVSNQTASLNAVVAGTNGLAKTGNGTLTLSQINTYTGGTLVNAGTLSLNTGGASGCIQGTLTINANGTLTSPAGTSHPFGYNGGATAVTNLVINGGTVNNAIAYGGSGGGNNAFQGMVNMTGGTLGGILFEPYNESGAGATVGFNTYSASITATIGPTWLNFRSKSPAVVFTVAAGTVPSGIDLLLSSTIGLGQGTAALQKAGPGTMVFAGTNNVANTIVSGGTLLVNGLIGGGTVTVQSGGTLGGVGTIKVATTVQAGGTLAAGTNSVVGSLTLSNILTLNSGSTSFIRLAKDGGSATNDLVRGIATLTYGGSLVLSNLGGTLARGDSFQIFGATNYTGSFASISSSPALGAGLNWWLDPAGTVWINGAPEASDFDMSVDQGGSNTVQIIGGKFAPTDADPGDTAHLTVTAVALNLPANGGAVAIAGGGSGVTYSASPTFSGTDSFAYTVSDGRGGSVTKTVTVTVMPAGTGANLVSGSLNVLDGVAAMQAHGIPGALYHLQYTSSLNPVNWQDVSDPDVQADPGNGLLSLTDSNAAGPIRFYRTRYVSGP